MSLNEQWFTEIHQPTGSAFSLHITAKLQEVQTPFQKIIIYDTLEFGRLMVIDGCIMLSSRENFIYHEMISHPALFIHADPLQVVIIGGGDCGTLREVLKHPIEKVTQIDIDVQVTRLSERYFPELCESNNDIRARLLFKDGVAWVNTAPRNSADIIIVDSTDPIGHAKDLFSLEFYRQCRRILKSEGILVQQSESPLFHLDLLQTMYKTLFAAGFKTVRSLHFPQCVYPSGWWTATLASDRNIDAFRIEAVQHKSFKTEYYNADIHQASFILPTFLKEALCLIPTDCHSERSEESYS